MRIQHDFEYAADYMEIADEFTDNDSEYQADVLNRIGLTFKIWSQDKTKTFTHVQLLEIAEQLDESGRWFINQLSDFVKEG